MLNENSRLIPSRIIAQSNAAISKLQADNELLRASITAINQFINDNTNQTQGLSNLRLKMEDYQTATNALILANDTDIEDHQKLITYVGAIDVNLNGLTIILNRDCRSTAIHRINGQIQHYQNIRPHWAETLIPIIGISRAIERNRIDGIIREYNRLLGLAQETLAKWEEREQMYNDIETATKGLFIEGPALRAAAERGINYITSAANLPYSYNSDGLISWRRDIFIGKNQFAILDENGRIISYDWDAIREALDRPYDEISDDEFLALAKIAIGLESEEYFARFLGYLADEVETFHLQSFGDRNAWTQQAYMEQTGMFPEGEIDFMTTLIAWSFCPRKVGTLQAVMGILADDDNLSTIRQRQGIISSLAQFTAPIQNGDLQRSNLLISQHGQRPNITLTAEYFENGYRRDIRVTVPSVMTQVLENGTFSTGLPRHWDRVHHHNSWRVTPIVGDHTVSVYVNRALREFHADIFSVSGSGLTRDVEDELVGAALGAKAGPVGGPAIMILINTIRSLQDDIQAMENLNQANLLTDSYSLADLGRFIELDYVMILQDDGGVQVILHEVPGRTQPFIDAINDSGHFDGHLTFNDFASDPVSINEQWNEIGEENRDSINNTFNRGDD